MGALAIFALILSIVSIGTGAYARFEVYPTYRATEADLAAHKSQTDLAGVIEEYHSNLNIVVYVALALGLLAFLLGFIAFWRRREPIAIVAVVFGLGGALLAFISAV
jgi:hypothetical protein